MISLLLSNSRIVLLGAAALAVAGGLVWSHSWMYSQGRRAEQLEVAKKIEKENEDAHDAAEDWRTRYRRCADAGGLFDFETGACDS